MKPTTYHTDPYVIEAAGCVTKIVEQDGKYHVELDTPLFYPEGGGQPSDKGSIDGISVEFVYENESGTFHVLNGIPHTDTPVSLQVDWLLRFDHMQQHTGQHVLSAVMDHLFNNATVGFRLTEDYVTIDLEGRLSDQELAAAEAEANRLIWANRPVKAYWPDQKTLESLPLRKKPQVEENIRIIEIDGYDYSPCCGTHVAFTGEIGFIKITRFENYKSGVRLEFRCGRRALAHYTRINDAVQFLGRELSSSSEALIPAFERYRDEKEQLKETIKLLKTELQAYEVDALLSGAEMIRDIRLIVQVNGSDMKDMKNIASRLAQNPSTLIVFASHADSKAQLLLQRSADLNQVDMKSIFASVSPMISAKGGGNPSAAQGGGDGTDALQNCVQEAVRLIREALR